MSSRKTYGYNYYESGSAARKLEYTQEKKTKTSSKKNVSIHKKTKNRTSAVVVILSMFAMTLILIYRYNIINEKNLRSQNLSNELTKTEAALLTSQIEVEQNTDLNNVEAYAKQKLGMQKPDKNQTIYVDTSKTSNSVELQTDTTFIQKITDSVGNFINKIFSGN